MYFWLFYMRRLSTATWETDGILKWCSVWGPCVCLWLCCICNFFFIFVQALLIKIMFFVLFCSSPAYQDNILFVQALHIKIIYCCFVQTLHIRIIYFLFKPCISRWYIFVLTRQRVTLINGSHFKFNFFTLKNFTRLQLFSQTFLNDASRDLVR